MTKQEKIDLIFTLVELSSDLCVNWNLTTEEELVVDSPNTGFRGTFYLKEE